jgi:hypothetical protein
MEQQSSSLSHSRAAGPDRARPGEARLSIPWLAAAAVAFAANLLLHLPLTDLSDALVERFGFPSYNGFLGWSFLLIGAGTLATVSLVGPRTRPHVRLAMVALVALAVVAHQVLLVTNIENIHYPQYALLVLLLARGGLPIETGWLAATLLGVGDESYQYLVLRRGTPSYLDWNDIVLNAIGAAFGVALLCRYYGARRTAPLCSQRTMAILALVAVAAAAVVAPPRLVPFFEPPRIGIPRFHILAASEGVIIVSVLWVGVRMLLARDRAPT